MPTSACHLRKASLSFSGLVSSNISVQLGNPKLISKFFKIQVISNFRINDIKNGGQGAPIGAFYHKFLIKKINKNAAIINLGGVANFALKNLDEALSHYKKAITIKPDYAEAYGNIGNALNYKGDIEGALKSYKKSSEIKPNLSTTHYNLGNLYREKRDLNLAIQSYKKAIEITPNFAEAQNNLGICFFKIFNEQAFNSS